MQAQIPRNYVTPQPRLPFPVRRGPGQFPLPNIGDWRSRWRTERERTRLVPEEAIQWFGITQAGTPGSTINSTAGTSNTVTVPASMTTSHYMIYTVFSNGNKQASMTSSISGWTTLLSPTLTNGSTGTMAIFGRFWASGMANPSVSWTTTAKNVGLIVPFLGVDATTPIDVAASSTAAAASTSATSPSTTALTMGACRLHIAGRVGTGTSTPDFRMVEKVDITTSATNPAAISFDFETDMASDAAGTRTSTITSAAAIATSIWLRPAVPTTFGLVRSAKANINGTTSGTVTLAAGDVANSPTGTLLVADVKYSAPNASPYNPSVPTMTGGTFVRAGTLVQSGTGIGNYASSIYYVENNTATGVITVTVTRPDSQDTAVTLMEFKGAATSGAYHSASSGTATGTSTTPSVTSGTLPSGQVLAISGAAGDGSTYTADTDYVPRWFINSNANANGATQTRELTGGGSDTASFTMTSAAWASTLAVFQAPIASLFPVIPQPPPLPHIRM